MGASDPEIFRPFNRFVRFRSDQEKLVQTERQKESACIVAVSLALAGLIVLGAVIAAWLRARA